METAWSEMKANITLANRLNATDEEVQFFHNRLNTAMQTAVMHCRAERKRKLEGTVAMDISDDVLQEAAKFTNNLPLANYAGILNLVPRLVNVVTVNDCTLTLLTHST